MSHPRRVAVSAVPASTPSLQVAVLQSEGVSGAPEANLAILEHTCGECARAGDRLLVTPELFLSGYFIGDAVGRLACSRDGDTMARVAAMARRHGIALCVGYPERDGDAVYNAVVLLGPDGGVLGHYRKHRLSGDFELGAFRRGAGNDLMAELDGMSVGVLICYDMEFPENVRRLAQAGMKLLLNPTALAQEFAIVSEKMVPTRAFENGIFIAYADRCGAEAGKRYAGGSCIVAPDGGDLARSRGGEGVIRALLEPSRYAHLEQRLPYLRDLAAG